MRLYKKHLAASAAALVSFAGIAEAGTTKLRFEIKGVTTYTNFRYSLLHSSSAQNPMSGNTLAHFNGTFDVRYDDVAGTLTFLSFSGDLHSVAGDANMTLTAPNQVLSFNGTNGSTDLVEGTLELLIDDGDGETTSVAFRFDAAVHNPLANQFFHPGDLPEDVPDTVGGEYALGLWGAGPITGGDVFGDHGRIGMDLFATGRLIPLPSPAAMASAGILGLVVSRRRR